MSTTDEQTAVESAGDDLVSFVYDLEFEDPSREAIEMAKKCFLDTVGVAIAGSQEPAAHIATDYLDAVGADGDSSTLAGESTFAPQHAALLNGVQGHALDYDDVCYYGYGFHPSVTIVPTLLAAGEEVGASGEELLTAHVAAFEFEMRITGGIGGLLQKHGYHTTPSVGTFGSTVAAGRLLGLERDELRHAIGIAGSLYSGLTANFGTMTKPLHAGLANQHGLQAAMLAERGFTANDDLLELPTGPWIDLFDGFDLEAATDDLGERWYTGDGIGIKIYPACGCTHGGIDAARALHDRGVDTADIESIRVYSKESARDMLRYDDPDTGLEGKFSMQYTVAAALTDGMVTLDHVTAEAVARPELQALVDVTEFDTDPDLETDGYMDGGFPGRVIVTTTDGETHEETVLTPTGTPEVPTSDEELERKFDSCVGRVLGDDRAEAAFDRLQGLETVADINDVTATLTR
jgi:2-methylcitrate dehydratase PrpD